VTLDRDHPGSGATSLRVEATTRVVGDELFAGGDRAIDAGGGLLDRAQAVRSGDHVRSDHRV